MAKAPVGCDEKSLAVQSVMPELFVYPYPAGRPKADGAGDKTHNREEKKRWQIIRHR